MKKLIFILLLISITANAQSWNSIITTNINISDADYMENHADKSGIHVVTHEEYSNDIKYYLISSNGATIRSATISTNGDLAKASNKVISFDEVLSITDYTLEQNYPNPFNPSTTIKYQIPNDGMVSLRIYDITGQEVKTLVNEAQSKGSYEINFDASNLSSGVYFYRLNSGGFNKSMKMLLLK